MPRPRKSLEELRLSGALQARPGRYKARIEAANSSQSTKPTTPAVAVGRPPAHLTVDEKKVWAEIVKQSPALTQADRLLLEVAVKLTVKLRAEGLKSAETTKLIALLEGFKGNKSNTESNPAVITAPVADTRTPQEIESEAAWAEFVRIDDEEKRVDKLSRAEMARREQTTPPDHLTEKQKKYWAGYLAVKRDLFPDEYTDSDKQCQAHIEWRDNQIALGLSTDYVSKSKQPEPEKVEYNLTPTPRPEPIEMDPARKREQMERKWSM